MDQVQQAFERAVPDPDDRELLKRKCGEESIQNIYKGAVDLKIHPETAFAKILVVQLQMMRDEGAFHCSTCSTWLCKYLQYNEGYRVLTQQHNIVSMSMSIYPHPPSLLSLHFIDYFSRLSCNTPGHCVWENAQLDWQQPNRTRPPLP